MGRHGGRGSPERAASVPICSALRPTRRAGPLDGGWTVDIKGSIAASGRLPHDVAVMSPWIVQQECIDTPDSRRYAHCSTVRMKARAPATRGDG